MSHNETPHRKAAGSTARRTTIAIERPGQLGVNQQLSLSALHRILGHLSGQSPEIIGVEVEVNDDFDPDLPTGFDYREVNP
jgi:hypothetical protein